MAGFNFAAALAQGHIGIFLEELARVKDPDDLPDFKGQTLLHFAVSQKRAWAIRAILRKGANPNLLTPNRKTALDIAVDPSSPCPQEIIDMLQKEFGAKKSADLTIEEVHNQLEKRYEQMISGKDTDYLLLKVLVRNHPQKEQGFVLDYMQRHSGRSPLHTAADAGHVGAIKFWLDLGLPPDLQTRGGLTAFDIEMGKDRPNPEIFDIILFYRQRRREDGRQFFGDGFVDETVIAIPSDPKIEDLRRPQSTVAGDTLLYRIARFGDVRDIIDVIQKSGGRLEEEDLTRPTHVLKSVIELAAERKQAALLLDPSLWKGRKACLQKVIEHLGPAKTRDIDTDELLFQADILALKTSAAKKGGYKL